MTAFAMVVRNHAGNLVFLASCISDPLEPDLAELKALTWAVNHVWWKSRDDLLLIKQHCNEHGWSFVWTPREANAVADLVWCDRFGYTSMM